jgi:hypothetical protein
MERLDRLECAVIHLQRWVISVQEKETEARRASLVTSGRHQAALIAEHVVAYDYEEPHPAPHPSNFWHIYETGMDSNDDATVTITAPNTPAMQQAIAHIRDAIDVAYALARSLRAASTGQE